MPVCAPLYLVGTVIFIIVVVVECLLSSALPLSLSFSFCCAISTAPIQICRFDGGYVKALKWSSHTHTHTQIQNGRCSTAMLMAAACSSASLPLDHHRRDHVHAARRGSAGRRRRYWPRQRNNRRTGIQLRVMCGINNAINNRSHWSRDERASWRSDCCPNRIRWPIHL